MLKQGSGYCRRLVFDRPVIRRVANRVIDASAITADCPLSTPVKPGRCCQYSLSTWFYRIHPNSLSFRLSRCCARAARARSRAARLAGRSPADGLEC
ncbi:hypothetical protein [Burkholderia plantarii]|uniref:hypothetical protein n=1 Tax=Burkholderia plantarii TaxID=41899 RepID=UPI000F4F150C|nr:hypothetical protein [Burkholderia plantarii]